MRNNPGNLALALGGGGARAAYQAGFLRVLAREFRDLHIPILTGVSAGAINAAFLANSTDCLSSAVEHLVRLWENITMDQIFRSNPWSLAGSFLHWSAQVVSGGAHLTPSVRGVVNTAPLRRFLRRAMDAPEGALNGIAENIHSGRLKAVGLTTTNYATGQSVTWVQGQGLTMWERPLRRSLPATLTVDHVMASCALPLFFPAVKLGSDWHGDGGVRLVAPLSPALHLGAERILAISTQYRKTYAEADQPASRGYPPPATVIGLLMNAVFLDMFDYDAQVMQHINRLLQQMPVERRGEQREVELLILRPSRDLEMLAADYEATLPRAFRHLTRGLGTRDTKSDNLLATVLFAPEYIRCLTAIGEQDAALRRDEVAAFLSGKKRSDEVQRRIDNGVTVD